MQENLAEADDARIVDFDARIADRADGDGQSNPLQERKVDVGMLKISNIFGRPTGSRRFTRSPGFFGISEGAATMQSWPSFPISRWSPYPVGPASYRLALLV
jgi:hypothetical protein